MKNMNRNHEKNFEFSGSQSIVLRSTSIWKFCLNATSSRWKKYWTIEIYFDIFSDRFCGLSLLLSYSKKVNVRAIIDLSTREYAVLYIFKNVYHAEQSFMPVAFSICSFSKNTHEWKSKEKRKSTLQNSS